MLESEDWCCGALVVEGVWALGMRRRRDLRSGVPGYPGTPTELALVTKDTFHR